MKWLYRLEYKYGNRYIPNLMTIIVGGMAIVYFLDMFFAPSGMLVSSFLSLNRAAVLSGQIWRLVTFVFVYPPESTFFLLISLYFYFIIGRNLEHLWGGFKLNIYYLCGMLGSIIAMFITGYSSNTYLNLSLFLAFASIMPDTQFLLFFVLPIKAKWLIYGYAIMLAIPLLQTFLFGGVILGLYSLVSLAFSLINYFIFFGPTMINGLKDQYRISQNRKNWHNQNRNYPR